MYLICSLILFLNFKSTKHYTPNQNKTPLPDSPMKALLKTQNTVIFIKLMSCFEFKNITLRQCCFYYGRQSWTIAYTSLLLLAFYRTFVGKLKKSYHHVMTTTSSNLVPVSPQDPEQGLQDCQDSNWVCIFTKVSTWL